VVAILVDNYTTFQRQFIDPIAIRLKELGYGVLVVTGRELKPDISSSQPTYNYANRIFSVAKSYDVAGCIIMTGCVGHNLARSEIDAFVKGFTHLPVVSLGVNIPSASSVCANNIAGMRRLMNHVVADSKRQNLVFIRGYRDNQDSIERENVFREVLRQNGIPIREELFLTGNFISLDAYNEMDSLLSRFSEIDVVVAANDEMALAAIRALKKHKYKIPADVLVAGFDDISKARYSTPQLTSVVQPVDEQVVATVETLASLMASTNYQSENRPIQRFDCSLVVRESTLPATPQVYDADYTNEESFESAVDLFVDQFIKEHSKRILQPGWGSYEILFHLVRLKLQTKADLYEHTFSTLLDHGPENSERDLGWWRDFEVIFSKFVLRMSRTQYFSSLIPSLLEMQTQLRELTWSMKSDIHVKYEYGTLLQARMQSILAQCKDLAGVKDVINVYFDQFGVKRAFLVLYNSTGGSVDCIAHLSYKFPSVGADDHHTEESLNEDFESRNILPKSLIPELYTGTLVLNPLYHDEIQIGYLLVDAEEATNLTIEFLVYSLNNALKRCLDSKSSANLGDVSTLSSSHL